MRGRLITIEGIDGAGKSTLAAGLRAALAERGIDARALREPGGVATSERIRTLVKDPGLEVGPRAEALLYAAARAQLVDELLAPALARGEWVLLDRFVDSSLTYQGVGRGLGVAEVAAINAFATGDVAPDRTLLVRIAPARARERAARRGEAPDRLEREAEAFFEAIADGYDELAARDPKRVRVLDGERSPDELVADALAQVDDLLG